MDIKEFFEKCQRFDWYYEYCDDYSLWLKGIENRKNLHTEMEKHPEFAKVYDAWREYSYSGLDFGSEQKPKPVLEDFIGEK